MDKTRHSHDKKRRWGEQHQLIAVASSEWLPCASVSARGAFAALPHECLRSGTPDPSCHRAIYSQKLGISGASSPFVLCQPVVVSEHTLGGAQTDRCDEQWSWGDDDSTRSAFEVLGLVNILHRGTSKSDMDRVRPYTRNFVGNRNSYLNSIGQLLDI